MKHFIKNLISCFAHAMVFVILGTTVSFAAGATTKVKMNQSSISLRVGQDYQLKLSGASKKITWNSKNKKIATVTSAGRVKAVKKGSTVIEANHSNKTYSAKVTVVEPITAKDFKYIETKKDGTKTNKNFITKAASKTEGHFEWYFQYSPAGLQIQTQRGIKMGAAMAEVEKAYGMAAYVAYTNKEPFHAYFEVKKTSTASDIWINYAEYKLSDTKEDFRIRFYYNSEKQVSGIILIKDYSHITYDERPLDIKVVFGSQDKYGDDAVRKEISGYMAIVLPENETFYFEKKSDDYTGMPINIFLHAVTKDNKWKDLGWISSVNEAFTYGKSYDLGAAIKKYNADNYADYDRYILEIGTQAEGITAKWVSVKIDPNWKAPVK